MLRERGLRCLSFACRPKLIDRVNMAGITEALYGKERLYGRSQDVDVRRQTPTGSRSSELDLVSLKSEQIQASLLFSLSLAVSLIFIFVFSSFNCP